MPVVPAEPRLRDEPVVERIDLGEGSWVDVTRGLVEAGSDRLYDVLTERMPWRQSRLFRYERWVDEPRLGASWSIDQPAPHPVVVDLTRWLAHRYGVRFGGVGAAWYRDGRDGQAFHRDRDLRYLDETVIAVLTLGARRPWLLRPRGTRYRHDTEPGGPTRDLAPASGDLLVMGGRCQADWEHSVPKVRAPVAGRVSLQWRWTSRRGRPVVGASYRAPRHFDRP